MRSLSQSPTPFHFKSGTNIKGSLTHQQRAAWPSVGKKLHTRGAAWKPEARPVNTASPVLLPKAPQHWRRGQAGCLHAALVPVLNSTVAWHPRPTSKSLPHAINTGKVKELCLSAVQCGEEAGTCCLDIQVSWAKALFCQLTQVEGERAGSHAV